jgi:hypothetical protein
MKYAKSWDGMIRYLRKRSRGNIHEKGIVTISSKSIYDEDADPVPQNVDLFLLK